MRWKISFSRDSLKFMDKNNMSEDEVVSYVRKAINKLKGFQENVDIKKMKGQWDGFYRLRVGKVRIIFDISFDERTIFIDRIDFRGDAYK